MYIITVFFFNTIWLMNNWTYSPFCFFLIPDTGSQEGGLQDSELDILHLLLSHLTSDREQLGIAQDTLDTFLKAVRRGKALYCFIFYIFEKCSFFLKHILNCLSTIREL